MELHVNKNFMGLHGEKLAVFADRVIRMTQESPYLLCPKNLLDDIVSGLASLRGVLSDASLKRKTRTDAIRAAEGPLLQSLLSLAMSIEQNAQCKSDINTTGFRPAAEQRKHVEAMVFGG